MLSYLEPVTHSGGVQPYLCLRVQHDWIMSSRESLMTMGRLGTTIMVRAHLPAASTIALQAATCHVCRMSTCSFKLWNMQVNLCPSELFNTLLCVSFQARTTGATSCHPLRSWLQKPSQLHRLAQSRASHLHAPRLSPAATGAVWAQACPATAQEASACVKCHLCMLYLMRMARWRC